MRLSFSCDLSAYTFVMCKIKAIYLLTYFPVVRGITRPSPSLQLVNAAVMRRHDDDGDDATDDAHR